jgi:hypothetical protein
MNEIPQPADENPVETPPPAKKPEVSTVGTQRQAPVGGWRDLFAGRVALAVMVLLWVAFLVWVLWKMWRVQ